MPRWQKETLKVKQLNFDLIIYKIRFKMLSMMLDQMWNHIIWQYLAGGLMGMGQTATIIVEVASTLFLLALLICLFLVCCRRWAFWPSSQTLKVLTPGIAIWPFENSHQTMKLLNYVLSLIGDPAATREQVNETTSRVCKKATKKVYLMQVF